MSFAIVQFSPITVADSRDKANTFRRSSILFQPHLPPNERVFGGAAGYRPRVRSAYYARVYVHSPEGHDKYRNNFQKGKGASTHLAKLIPHFCIGVKDVIKHLKSETTFGYTPLTKAQDFCNNRYAVYKRDVFVKFGYATIGLCVLASCGGGGGTSVQDETALALLPNGQGYSRVEQIQRIEALTNTDANAKLLARKDIPKSKTSYSGQIFIGGETAYDVAAGTFDIGVGDFNMSIDWDRTTQEISGSISNIDILRGNGNEQSYNQSNLQPLMTGIGSLPFVADVKFNGSVRIETASGGVGFRKNNAQMVSGTMNISEVEAGFVRNNGRTYFTAGGSASITTSDTSSTLFNNNNLFAVAIAD